MARIGKKVTNTLDDWYVKLIALRAAIQAGRVTSVERLTLWQMLLEPAKYSGIAVGLATLPIPDTITIGRRKLAVPQDLEQFAATICYGQRLYFSSAESFDIDLIMRYIGGYYQPLYDEAQYNEQRLLSFQRKVLSLPVKVLYPVAQHLVNLMDALAERERKLLYREPTKQERAAGIDRLTRFASLTSLLFLQESFKATEAEVMLLPYDDCLVRFMLAKEQNAYSERLTEIYRKQQTKGHGKTEG